MLIAATGCTGLTMPDRPFNDPRDGKPIMAKPNLNMAGRTAGSPDNAQGTHFFLINDSGTYFLRKLPPAGRSTPSIPTQLIERADDGQGEAARSAASTCPRQARLPGLSRFQPLPVEPARHDHLLSGGRPVAPVHQRHDVPADPARGARPTIVDDRNFYRPAGVKKWVDKGFLNKDIKVPLGAIWPMRTQIEADLLIQNLFLVAEAMGLGAWIHGSISPPVLMGDPEVHRRSTGPCSVSTSSRPSGS